MSLGGCLRSDATFWAEVRTCRYKHTERAMDAAESTQVRGVVYVDEKNNERKRIRVFADRGEIDGSEASSGRLVGRAGSMPSRKNTRKREGSDCLMDFLSID